MHPITRPLPPMPDVAPCLLSFIRLRLASGLPRDGASGGAGVARSLGLLAMLAIVLVATTMTAYASTALSISIPGAPSGAQLSTTVTLSNPTCPSPSGALQETVYSFGPSYYVVSGSSYLLNGYAYYYEIPKQCTNSTEDKPTSLTGGRPTPQLASPPGIVIDPATFSVPLAATPSNSCTLTLTPSAGSATASISCTPAIAGFINPKYVVMGVTYAPPGPSSYVQYTNTTSVGNTTALTSSFQNDVGFSVSVSGKVFAGYLIGNNFTLTATESTDYTVGSNSSNTTTLTKATTISYKTAGTANPVGTTPPTHDDDYIWLWINPEVLLSYEPSVGNNPANVTWTGYAFDPHDPASGMPVTGQPYNSGPDVIEVQVGCLNGHVSCPQTLTWLNGTEGSGSYVSAGLLARTWASGANGYQWPTGEVSGLTFNDVCQILAFDPLATSPSGCPTPNNYTLLATLPSTTSDGRFTKDTYPPNPIQFTEGAPTEQFSLAQTNTQSVATGNTVQIKQAFSVEESFASNWFDIFQSTTTLKESDTLTWNYSTLNTLTTTTTLTDALSITGPPDSPVYTGPVEFLAYQDNLFGTFVFVPVY